MADFNINDPYGYLFSYVAPPFPLQATRGI